MGEPVNCSAIATLSWCPVPLYGGAENLSDSAVGKSSDTAFLEPQHLVRPHVGERLQGAGRPANLDPFCLCCCAQAEEGGGIAGGAEAGAGANPARLDLS